MNWTRSHTPERATPIAWRILRADVGLCFDEGWYHLGTILLLGFTFMLRTNEFLMLKKSDISFQGSATIMLRLAAAKTAKQFEQSLVFDDEVVVKLVQKGLQQIHSESLWPFSTPYFRKCFHAIHRFSGSGKTGACAVFVTARVSHPLLPIFQELGLRNDPRSVA